MNVSREGQEAAAESMPTREGEGSSSSGDPELRLPWMRFYWAVIDADLASEPTKAAREPRCLDSLQGEVPCPLEDLEVTWTQASNGKLLACAIPTASLQELAGEREAHESPQFVSRRELLSIGPTELPPSLRADVPNVDPREINFLTGEFTPLRIQSLRRSALRWAVCYAAVWIALVGVGAWLRGLDARHRLESSLAQSRSEVQAAGFGDTDSADPMAALAREIARVRLSRGSEAAKALPADLAKPLAMLLRKWPDGIESRTSRISMTDRVANLSIQVPNEVQAQVIGNALASCDGWALQPIRTQRSASGLQLSATLKRAVPMESK